MAEATQTTDVLIFACSGASNLGEISDRAARKLMRDGHGKMFCLAGIGGQIPDMLDRARTASGLLVLDGCEKDCARQCLLRAGLPKMTHVRLTDLGLEKGKTLVTEDVVSQVAAYAGLAAGR